MLLVLAISLTLFALASWLRTNWDYLWRFSNLILVGEDDEMVLIVGIVLLVVEVDKVFDQLFGVVEVEIDHIESKGIRVAVVVLLYIKVHHESRVELGNDSWCVTSCTE